MIYMGALFFGLCCAFIGTVINVIMPNEPILNWWFRFGNRIGIKVVKGEEVERWFYRPIWGCEKCLSGQVALWCYPLLGADYYELCGKYAFAHIIAVSSAIYCTLLLTKLITRHEN